MINTAAHPDTRIAVVIVTRDRIAGLLHTLHHIYALPEQPRVIVVDNGSSDGTSEKVRRHYPQTHVISLSENLGSAGRNLGVLHADCPYIAFSDDDSWWASGSLSRASDLLDSYPKLALIAARILVGQEQKCDPTCQYMAAGKLPINPYSPGIPILGFIACGSIIRKSAYLAYGGFEKRFGIGGEEGLLAIDLAANGWHLAYIDDIVAYHHPSPVRNPHERRRNEVRNALWTTWLRRPSGAAVLKTIHFLKPALRDPSTRAGLLDALKKISWVIQSRRRIPESVESALKLLEK